MLAVMPTMLPGLRQLSMAFDRVMSPHYHKYGAVRSRLLLDWEKIVGKTLAQGTAPGKLVFRAGERSDGLLYVEIYHSSLATQMMYMEPIILEKIATYFGYKAVAKMRLVQKPVSMPKIALKNNINSTVSVKSENPKIALLINDIEDNDLKASLENLLKSLK